MEANLYSLDPYIISVLFNTEEPEMILEIYRNMLDKVGQVFDATVSSFLREKQQPDDLVKQALEIEDYEKLDPALKQILADPTLGDKIQFNVNLLIKVYYDQLLPGLTPEKKADLDKYLQDNKANLDDQQKLIIKGLSGLSDILESSGAEDFSQLAKQEELDKMVTEYLNKNSAPK
jgi:hypothetical protein